METEDQCPMECRGFPLIRASLFWPLIGHPIQASRPAKCKSRAHRLDAYHEYSIPVDRQGTGKSADLQRHAVHHSFRLRPYSRRFLTLQNPWRSHILLID